MTQSAELEAFLSEVDIDTPWALIKDFSVRPRWKTEDVNRAGEYITDSLRQFGVPVKMYQPEIYLSIPYEASVVSGGANYRAKPPAYSISVPEGVTGDLIHVPASYSGNVASLFSASTKSSLDSDSISGKLVITEGYGLPHKISELQDAGAIGVITINPGEDIHWAICTPIWGSPGLNELSRKPRIPVVSVNREDGKRLIEAADNGEQATIHTRLEEGWFSQNVVVAEIPGSVEPESFVLLHGHYDSWDVGVGDNATGDATLLEIARVLWRRRTLLRRSVRLAWWPGHSTGRYAGSTWYADEFGLELDQHCVAHLNCDSPGCRWATEFSHISWLPETEAFARSIISDMTGLPSSGERPPRAGDWSFNNIGLSGFFMLSSTMSDELRAKKGYYAVGGCGGNIAWHTENDTLEIADREILVRDIRVYLAAVLGIANSAILPFDWRAATKVMKETLSKYELAAGKHFDFKPTCTALEDLSAKLERFYAGVSDHSIAIQNANSIIQKLARILVPLDHARETRFSHDPALPVPSLPALSAASAIPNLPEQMINFAITELRRGQNEVVNALRRAAELVDRGLGW
jgi:hypothetical protein